MMGRPSGLGRGLGALIPPKPGASAPAAEIHRPATGETGKLGSLAEISIQDIERNPYQPRTHFDHAQLEDLISSIKEHGILQPLVVTPLPNGRYQLIAGERRLRAATIAGLAVVPAIIREASDQHKLELALIENVQRSDLNPIEEAIAYQRLMDEFSMTQDEVSQKVGKSRPQVANMLRLLQLPEEIKQALIERKISASNARTLLSLPTEAERMAMFQAMLANQFTVRQTEERVNLGRKPRSFDPNVAAAESKLREALHAQVKIKRNANGSGEIKVGFASDEEFQHLLEKLQP